MGLPLFWVTAPCLQERKNNLRPKKRNGAFKTPKILIKNNINKNINTGTREKIMYYTRNIIDDFDLISRTDFSKKITEKGRRRTKI
jgi:hypothetical protein